MSLIFVALLPYENILKTKKFSQITVSEKYKTKILHLTFRGYASREPCYLGWGHGSAEQGIHTAYICTTIKGTHKFISLVVAVNF